MTRRVSAAVGPPTLTYIATASAGATFPDGTHIKYAAVASGTASNDRFLIVSLTDIQPTSGNAVTSIVLQVSGQTDVTMTLVGNLSTSNGMAVIGYAPVPSAYGTTVDILAATATGWSNTPAVSTYSTLLSTLNSTVPTSSSATSASATSINTTLATSSGGFIVAAGINGIATGSTASFTSANETYSQDAAVTLSSGRHTFAHAGPVGTIASDTITMTQVGTADVMAFAVAAWR